MDCQDETDVWRVAKVLQVQPDKIAVVFDGWSIQSKDVIIFICLDQSEKYEQNSPFQETHLELHWIVENGG